MGGAGSCNSSFVVEGLSLSMAGSAVEPPEHHCCIMHVLGKMCPQLVPAHLQPRSAAAGACTSQSAGNLFRSSCSKGLHQAAWRHPEQRCAFWQQQGLLQGWRCRLCHCLCCTGLQANIPPAQILERYSSLFRWADYLQHKADRTGVFAPLNIRKPTFRPPPPPAAAAPKVGQRPDAQVSAYANPHISWHCAALCGVPSTSRPSAS